MYQKTIIFKNQTNIIIEMGNYKRYCTYKDGTLLFKNKYYLNSYLRNAGIC